MQTFIDFKSLLNIKRYSPNTIKTYYGLLLAFQKFIGLDIPINSLTNNEVLKHISNVVRYKGLSYATQKQLISALKLYYKEIHGKEMNFYTVYPRNKPKPLPVILSQKEVKSILESTTNIKHKAMLTIIYALGLRSGELINLKLEDIHKDRKQVHIKTAKGNKDRVLPIPKTLKPIMNQYYKKYKPSVYLFNGQGKPQYNAQSLRKVLKSSCRKAGINKTVTVHSLRHAYATHLMDLGTDVRIIQELLGHQSIKTTMIYTHVTTRSIQKIKSPLDFL